MDAQREFLQLVTANLQRVRDQVESYEDVSLADLVWGLSTSITLCASLSRASAALAEIASQEGPGGTGARYFLADKHAADAYRQGIALLQNLKGQPAHFAVPVQARPS
jgi:hypothetical protein